MPHLSDLQRKYTDSVTVLALSDEKKEVVESFLSKQSPFDGKTWNQAMEFTVATDPDGSVKQEIFAAAGQRGIPSSFIIGRTGHIEWIGHPMGMDGPLAQVVAGTWDREAAAKELAERQALQRAFIEARAKMAAARDKPEEMLAILDGLLEKFPGQVQLQLQKWELLLTKLHRHEPAYALARELLAAHPDDANLHNQIAWTIVDDAGVKQRDLDLALRVAQRANELTKSENAAILDTLARAHYERGELDHAVSWQERAVKHAEGRMAQELKPVLDKYRKARAEAKAKADAKQKPEKPEEKRWF